MRSQHPAQIAERQIGLIGEAVVVVVGVAVADVAQRAVRPDFNLGDVDAGVFVGQFLVVQIGCGAERAAQVGQFGGVAGVAAAVGVADRGARQIKLRLSYLLKIQLQPFVG